MSLESFFSGVWRAPSRGEVVFGGAFRRLTRGEAYINGQWRPTFTFIPPLSLTATPRISGSRYTQKPTNGIVTSNYATATPSGGAGPFNYSWGVIDGPATIGTPDSAVTNVSAFVAANNAVEGNIIVQCTDSLGSQASAIVGYTLTNGSNF